MPNDAPKPLPAPPPGKRRVTRKQAAMLLGRDIDTVLCYHGNQLHPAKDAEGRWIYDRDEVERLAVVLKVRRPRHRTMPKGDIAAEVFRYLDLGLSFRDIVMRLRIDPEEIRRLQAEYEADGGLRPLTAKERTALERERLKLDTERVRLEKMQMSQAERVLRRGQ